ncbi:hypothetical protein TGGT1_312360 [Toxoplasma gondii GT1]|uniref:Uncharacterized protein n=2 Tax=Toxoplasma gondii TaxID=5811 RepID=S7UTS5_TOXGG|nr:hypothetical protein TGGT1_312360 [Toxoplasma gondii GT1]KAF4639388.1 hypothetical protein TGRH88_051600 [Toxoplasma gondii]
MQSAAGQVASSFLPPLLRPPVPETLLFLDSPEYELPVSFRRATAEAAELLQSWEALWGLLCKHGQDAKVMNCPRVSRPFSDSTNHVSLALQVAQETLPATSAVPPQDRNEDQGGEDGETVPEACLLIPSPVARLQTAPSCSDSSSAPLFSSLSPSLSPLSPLSSCSPSHHSHSRCLSSSSASPFEPSGRQLFQLSVMFCRLDGFFSAADTAATTAADSVQKLWSESCTALASTVSSLRHAASLSSSGVASSAFQEHSGLSAGRAKTFRGPECLGAKLLHQALANGVSLPLRSFTVRQAVEREASAETDSEDREIQKGEERPDACDANRSVSVSKDDRAETSTQNTVAEKRRACASHEDGGRGVVFLETKQRVGPPSVCCYLRGLENLTRAQWRQTKAVLSSVLADAAACARVVDRRREGGHSRREDFAGSRRREEAKALNGDGDADGEERPEHSERPERGETPEHKIEAEPHLTEAAQRGGCASSQKCGKEGLENESDVRTAGEEETATGRSEERCRKEEGRNTVRVLIVLGWDTSKDERCSDDGGSELGARDAGGGGGRWGRQRAKRRQDIEAWVHAANQHCGSTVRVHFFVNRVRGGGRRRHVEGLDSFAEDGKEAKVEQGANQSKEAECWKARDSLVNQETDKPDETSSVSAVSSVDDGQTDALCGNGKSTKEREGGLPDLEKRPHRPDLDEKPPAANGDVLQDRSALLLSLLRDGNQCIKQQRQTMLFLGGHEFFPAPPVGVSSLGSPQLSSSLGAPRTDLLGQFARQLEDLVYVPLLLRSRLSASSWGSEKAAASPYDCTRGIRGSQVHGSVPETQKKTKLLRDCNSLYRDSRGFLPPPPRLLIHSCLCSKRRRPEVKSSSLLPGSAAPRSSSRRAQSSASSQDAAHPVSASPYPAPSVTRPSAENLSPQTLIQLVGEKYSACIQTFLLPLSAIASPYVGQTEEKLRRLLRVAANASPSVLVLLGIDQLGRKRDRGGRREEGEQRGARERELVGGASDATQTSAEASSQARWPTEMTGKRECGYGLSPGNRRETGSDTDRASVMLAEDGASGREGKRTEEAYCDASVDADERERKGARGRREGGRANSFQRRLLATLLVALDEVEDRRRRHEQLQREEAEDDDTEVAETGGQWGLDSGRESVGTRRREFAAAAAGMAIIGVASGTPDTLDEAVVRAGRLDNWLSWC